VVPAHRDSRPALYHLLALAWFVVTAVFAPFPAFLYDDPDGSWARDLFGVLWLLQPVIVALSIITVFVVSRRRAEA
jgi:hypothetical protein